MNKSRQVIKILTVAILGTSLPGLQGHAPSESAEQQLRKQYILSRSAMFIQRQYNDLFPLVSLAEDVSNGKTLSSESTSQIRLAAEGSRL
jgi:hypothetical protein